MGVDTKLFVRTTVSPEDIVEALKALGKKDVEWKPTTVAPGYCNIFFKSETKGWDKRMIHFHHNLGEESLGIPSNLMSLNQNEEAEKVFEQLAKIFGGVLQRTDTIDDCEMYRTAGYGNVRWLLDRFFACNPNISEDSEKQVEAFQKWAKNY